MPDIAKLACTHVHRESRWLAGPMGFLWVSGFSFFHCVASPFHSFVTTNTQSFWQSDVLGMTTPDFDDLMSAGIYSIFWYMPE